ncbi:protein prune homolog 2-like [Dendronephthya gigantea]|uniref:protein prune homolog 2-like n=1 Tax=Dendronephthya gigantea TaxID=151771 RepID=UPI00106AF6E6|nr:protein prune homolog 2-like [Dendronephthya gigantea]
MTANGISLDKFLSQVTTNVVRTAIEKIADQTLEIMYDEESLLECLNEESFKDSVIETSSIHYHDLPEIASDEITSVYLQERCSKLVEVTLNDVYDELQQIFDLEGQEMIKDNGVSQKKIHSLDCIKNSDGVSNYFQDLSLSIIRNAYEKCGMADGKHLQNDPFLVCDMENDIENIGIDTQQGNDQSIVEQSISNSIDKCNLPDGRGTADENYLETVVGKKDSNSTESFSGFTTANSTMYKSSNSFLMTNNETQENGTTTIDSEMFTTADDFQEQSNESSGLHFDKEFLQETTVMQSTPERFVDTTITPGPRQSTPVANDMSHDLDISLPTTETSNIIPEDLKYGSNSGAGQQKPLQDQSMEHDTNLPKDGHHIAEYVRTLQEISGDESSLGDPSSPRTLSRQSSAFGNVTLEFDTDWEASMKGLQDETRMKSKPEEKHKVILHELSFEDHHRLKAPELLCPVFLAVQDDSDNESGDERTKRNQRMSQSIDDLCEMISEDSDDDDQDLGPLRRRAMSLECKKPSAKEQRKKAPTREELMAAFEELQHEIMEEKDSEHEIVEREGVNEEDEGHNETQRGEIMDIQEYNGLNDPLRWQTVVFNGQHKVIDLKLLEPFLKVLTHGGYHHEGDKKTVIVVLTACNLPNKKMKRYAFLMEQLFFFIISTMDLLVTSEDYIFVYFHGGTSKNQSPSFSWLKKYYQYIDHRLRKSVTKVFVVHPNLWLKSVFRLCRPFLSSNFARKLKFVNNLKELSSYIKTDFIFIPDEVIRVDPNYRKQHDS